MSTDSIVNHYEVFGYNSKFDLVLMKSVYSLDILSKNQILQPIIDSNNINDKGLVSPKNDWIALGLDPYVVTGLKEQRGFQYNELTFGDKWKNELTESDFALFQSSVMFQFGRKNIKKSLGWLQKIDNQTLTIEDTTTVVPYQLTKLSLIKRNDKTFVYPSQSQKFGAFYDAIGVGIVRHSSKYTVASKFIDFHQKLAHNQNLCNNFHVLPLQNPKNLSVYTYQNNYPFLFRCSPRKAVTNFRDLHKVRHRIE